jgi:ubiquinone/menaquinone biosynthesis C-methylase UbiE
MEVKGIVSNACKLAGYADLSRLRQDEDLDAIVAWIPDSSTSLLDLACGSGALLLRAARSKPNLNFLAGIDVSEERVNETSEAVSSTGITCQLIKADITNPPSLDRVFDVVTMTSALHWLYPHESSVFCWVERFECAWQ